MCSSHMMPSEQLGCKFSMAIQLMMIILRPNLKLQDLYNLV